MNVFYKRTLLLLSLLFAFGGSYGQRFMEKLGRGVIATRTASSKVLISWRLLGTEQPNTGFNVYRVSGGQPVKLNSDVLQAGTNFEDVTANLAVANTYYVRPVVNGTESDPSAAYTLPASTPVQPFYRVPIKNIAGYYVRYVFTGDLDGDGEFDYVINKQPTSTQSLPDLVEGYKSDGTLLWTMDLGSNSTNRDNISPGSSALNNGHGDNITVYDINCDGKAEVIIRTANGVKFADGATLTDANNSKQFISVVNGLTGVEISRTLVDNPYLSVGPMNGHIGIAYLDGVRPSVVWESANRNASGSFNEIVTTWNWTGNTLTFNWRYDITDKGIPSGHQIKIFDIDGDGKDEIVPQGYALDHDGTLMYNLLDQSIDHGDRFFISDMDPSRPGLEMYGIQQGYSKAGIQWYYLDAKTGKVLLSQSSPENFDMARGMVGDLDPRYDGYEFYTFVDGLYNVSGTRTSDGTPSSYPNLRFFWDGDLGSENLDNLKFTKWNHLTSSETRLYTASGVRQVARNVPVFYGDIVGDWREEVIYESSDQNYLIVYTSPYFTSHRIYTLPHNPGYRNDMAVRGYYQSHMTDYFIGFNMQQPPLPPIQNADKYWVGNTSAWDKSQSNWTSGSNSATFADGDVIMFDIRGNNADTIALNTDVAPGRMILMNPENKDYIVKGPGKLTGTMEVQKGSRGRFMLAGNHDYTGDTEISEGILQIDGSLTSKVIIKPLGALGGRGTLHGGLVLEKAANAEGGRIDVGLGANENQLGSLTISGNLTASGNNFHFDVMPQSQKLNDTLIISGNASFSGLNKLIVAFADGTLVPGTYTLIRSTGTLSSSPENFVIEGADGVSKSLIIEDNEIKLKINTVRSAADVVWKGSTDNIWDFEKDNFESATGQVSFVSNDNVRFDGSSVRNDIELTETAYPSAMTFDAESDYTISGTGRLAGTMDLIKNNTGTVNLVNTNNIYTGKTIVNGGTLSIGTIALAGQPSSLGAGAADPANIQLNNAGLVINTTSTTDRGISLTGNTVINVPKSNVYAIFLGDIKGSGSLTKDGDGALFMVGAKSFSGPVVIKKGTVNLRTVEGNVNGLGTSNNITLEDATLSMEDVRNYAQAAWNLIVPDGKNAYLNTDGRSTLLGTLTGAGTLNINIPYVRTDFKGNWSGFTGQINISGSDFRIGNSFGYANAAIHLSSGYIYTISGSSSTIAIGQLSGAAGTSINGANWTIGNRNSDARFSGNILGNSLTKTGTGTLTLDGNNNYSGNTSILAGRLLVNNAPGKRGLGRGTVSVANGAILGGSGGVSGAITINAGGTIQPGADGIGTFTDSTSVTMMAGAIAEMEISRSAQLKDVVKVTGSITFNGKLLVREISNTGFVIGDSFKLFDAGTYNGNFSSVEPATPGEGMAWKFIPATGTLEVVAEVLPVSLFAFEAARHNDRVKLSWSTLSESNNDRFEIERSADGHSFMHLTSVKGAGNSSSKKDYLIFDQQPLQGDNYYQLKQYDSDGKVTLHGVKHVRFLIENPSLSVYPNPFTASFNIILPAGQGGSLSVLIMSADGRRIEDHKLTYSPSGIYTVVPGSPLPAGTYLVTVHGDTVRKTFTLVAQ